MSVAGLSYTTTRDAAAGRERPAARSSGRVWKVAGALVAQIPGKSRSPHPSAPERMHPALSQVDHGRLNDGGEPTYPEPEWPGRQLFGGAVHLGRDQDSQCRHARLRSSQLPLLVLGVVAGLTREVPHRGLVDFWDGGDHGEQVDLGER